MAKRKGKLIKLWMGEKIIQIVHLNLNYLFIYTKDIINLE
jgi:hypothetical protein